MSMLRREVIAVDENNNPSPENVMQSDDVLDIPSSFIFGFHDIYPWHQSGNFPIGRSKLKMTQNPRIQHMSRLDLFMNLYGMEYIKDVVILETNKSLNSAMNLSEYFCVIGCRLILACCVGHSVSDFFLRDTITPQKGAPIRLNHIISGRRLEKIDQVMSYKNLAIPEFTYLIFQQRQMQEGWNKKISSHFESSWVNLPD